MPLPKRPSGGAAPKKAAPPQFGEQENSADEDFSLPELDDFALPDLMLEPEATPKESSGIPKAVSIQATTPDGSRNRFTRPSSTNQAAPKPAQTAASDAPETFPDDDETTALNRALGLLDDDEFAERPQKSLVENSIDSDDDNDVADSSLEELEENLSESEDDDEFADLLRGFDETVREPEAEDKSSTGDDLDDDWETALAGLEAYNESVLPEVTEPDSDSDEEEEEDEEDDEDGDWNLEEFTPPSNPFEAIPEGFQNGFDTDDEDEDEEEEDDTPEDDFVPPSDPFANPFDNQSDEVEEPDEEEESSESEEEITEASSRSSSLKNKAAALLSPTKAKKGLSDYFAKLKAELHGEDPPQSNRNSERDSEEEEQQQESEDQTGGSSRSPLKIFGFLSPIRSFYTAIVNIIFGIITAILGILSKLPLIGFIFKIALEATKVLRSIAQYIPLVFFIAALVAVSYFSVPRDSLIALPDSGGATFTEFTYDSASNSVSGVITNTGDIIADVQPEFTIKTIQPGINPISWVIPGVTSTCVAEAVQVDIDATIKVTAKCGEPITGFIPRATGELK